MDFEKNKEVILQIEKYVGVRLIPRQVEKVCSWIDLGFDLECIRYACDISFERLNRFDVKYVDGILASWNKDNLKTYEEIKAEEIARKRKAAKIEKSGVMFKDERHKQKCKEILLKMQCRDEYHAALAYLLALDNNIQGQRISDCFDFSEDSIKPSALDQAWITGTDRRVLLLAFNLWNDAQQANVSDVFGAGYDLEYLLEAVRIRFGAVVLTLSGKE